MAIDKIIPIRLDKSSDFRLVPTTSMVDALNMLITENESSGDATTTGNLGVLKNIKGNEEITYLAGHGVAEGNAKIIGSVTDTKLKIIYFFVWHELLSEHGVYAYDQLGKLPIQGDTKGKIVRIHKSSLYAFPEHGFVKGDIIYTSQTRLDQASGGDIKGGTESDFEKDAILYFTDNTNEPRKINVYMAMLGADNGYGPADKIDFITACPKTPLTPITFTFGNDTARTTSNFKSGPGFQFAYQFISKDGVESAISPYSDIAFPPSIVNQGSRTRIDHNIYNKCLLEVPLGGDEIESIRILARQFNNPELVILDEVSNISEAGGSSLTYSFYNDRIVRGVSENEVNKQYDNLPRKAQAQSVVDNRLMYGDYLEGFDNVKTDCSATVIFKDRPSEMVDFDLRLIPAVSEQERAYAQEYSGERPADSAVNKSAGYILDAVDLPNQINAGTTINVTVTIAPNRNYHIYQASNSYHQSRHKGAFNQYEDNNIDYSVPETYDGSPYGSPPSWASEGESYGHQSIEASGGTWLQGTVDTETIGVPLCGDNFGVGAGGGADGALQGGINVSIEEPTWRTELGDNAGSIVAVKYGTSAANPLILQGQAVIFSCSFTMGEAAGDGREAVMSIVSQLLGGIEPTWGGGVESGFLTIHDVKRTYSYDIDLGVENGDKFPEGSAETKMITAVIEKTAVGESAPFATPLGYFIVNRAKVTFSLERDESWRTITASRQMLRLVIDKIEDIDLVTMVKKMWPGQQWQAITKSYLTGGAADFNAVFATEAAFDTDQWHPPLLNTIEDFSYDYETSLNNWWEGSVYISGTTYGSDADSAAYTQLKSQRFFGYLEFQQDLDEGINQFFRFNRDDYSAQTLNSGESEMFPFSLLDGEGGPGGKVAEDGDPMKAYGYEGILNNAGGFSALEAIHYKPPLGFSSTPRTINILKNITSDGGYWFNTGGVPFKGAISTNFSGNEFANFETNLGVNEFRSFLPLIQGPSDPEALSDNTNLLWPYSNAGDFDIDFEEKHPQVEVLNVFFSFDEGGGPLGEVFDRTFKSNANHDFGIVYYDERGRHGFVNHLTTVYVPGYSQQERGSSAYGRSVINLSLPNTFKPPEWAHYYKIAYTKNTTVQNFIQYSSGGAFVPPENTTALIQDEKIYISLNYLQESPISYVADWGARTPEGGLSMFKAIDGGNQKLRVISAYNNSNNRSYFYNYEFDIIDVVLLGDTENPLFASGETGDTNPEKLGEFVIVKSNPSAFYFDYTSVFNESDYWGNNCIIELFTPQKSLEEESRFYYEIGDTYEVSNPGAANRAHNVSNITLNKGDVWWRKVAVNFREYNNGEFANLIQESEDGLPNSSSSNFKSYYLETETASDLFKADATLIGRPNIILEDAVETVREASITYSGKSNPNSSKLNYSSFNLTLSNFKELQEEFGDINYMCNMEGDVFVIQSDRCTLVPASKTLFSDVQGASTVAASKSPLGQERVFAGRAGCDNNPESVVQVGAYVYFAHKNLGKVYRFNPSNGVQEISEQGMASYFRGIFKAAMDKSDAAGKFINHDDVRVVGGFDPVNEEYLLTVLDPVTYGVTEDSGGGGIPEEGGEVDLVAVNSLEQQMYNVMDAFLTAEDESGDPVFDVDALPLGLKDFYNDAKNNGLTGELDFDPNSDGVLEPSEVVSANDISTPVQEAIDSLVNAILAANPQLTASLETILNTIASQNSSTDDILSSSEVTGEMLNTWADENFGGEGGYSTLEPFLANVGISVSQLLDIHQQIDLVSGVSILEIKADLDGDGAIASADLLLFLAAFGQTYNPDSTTLHTLPVAQVQGCTDPSASNYNPDATQDNGSCSYT